MNIDTLFGNLVKADVNGSGKYMGEGRYLVETKNIFAKEGRNPLKPGDNFICEFTIIESSNPGHEVGSTGSFVVNMANPFASGNIVELAIALLGYENTRENQKNADIREQADVVMRATCGSDSAKAALATLREGLGPDYGVLVGKRLRLECVKKPTKAGGEFTVHKWSPVKAKAA